jgi:mono/diheme cytochrome c family protein
MQRYSALLTLLAAVLSAQCMAAAGPVKAQYVREGHRNWGMLKQYCSKCHNTDDWAGGVAFDTLSPSEVPSNANIWEAAVRKLSGGLMPPPGNPQPPQKQVDRFVSWLQHDLDAADAAGEEPLAGHVSIQRLNRTEYGESVKALLGVTVNVDDLLPPETEVGGFDNIAAALSVSPVFLDQYVRAARVVARLAVGESAPRPATAFFPAPRTSQDTYQPGMPLGTRGGMEFTYDFPADGEYRFTVKDLDVGLYTWATETRSTVALLVDGREVFHGDLGGLGDLEIADREGAAGAKALMQRFANIPVHVAAGQHRVVLTFVKRAEAENDDYVDGNGFFARLRTARLLGGVEVSGPFGPTRLSQTASRQKIFVCEPRSKDEERPCALRITAHLARLAFRRPLTQSDVASLMPFYDYGSQHGGFNAGIEQMVSAVLASPDFLYRAIVPSRGAPAGKPHTLTSLELASRLSFFLWSQGPDEELLDLAIAGKLTDPKVLDAQALRMLADPRAQTLVDDFAFHWLDLDKIDSVVPDPKLFPDYSVQLRNDFTKEAQLFIRAVLLGGGSVLDLLDGNYTYLNEQLARHYGIDSVFGDQFRRVRLENPVRWGLLGKAAFLMETSYADRTSPVRRGAWVLDKLMGTPPAQPPPNVNMDLSQKPGEKPTTVRARLALHRTNPSCSQCHGVIDPYGLALENFNATGEWRTFDYVANEQIDSSSTLPNGTPLRGVNDLRRLLVSRPDRFVTALTEKLLMYALGRKIAYYDMPQVRAIVESSKQDDYRFSSIVLGIVGSDDFRMQIEGRPAAPAGLKTASTRGPAGLSP